MYFQNSNDSLVIPSQRNYYFFRYAEVSLRTCTYCSILIILPPSSLLLSTPPFFASILWSHTRYAFMFVSGCVMYVSISNWPSSRECSCRLPIVAGARRIRSSQSRRSLTSPSKLVSSNFTKLAEASRARLIEPALMSVHESDGAREPTSLYEADQGCLDEPDQASLNEPLFFK